MFDGVRPRVFALPPGADFAGQVAAGLRARAAAPWDMARATVIVPTAALRSALRDALAAGPGGYLPRILTMGDLAGLATPDLDDAGAGPLDRILDLARLVRGLLGADPALGPSRAAFGLARSLADLADEMAEEGVPASALAHLDTGDHAERWQRLVPFLTLAAPWIDGTDAGADGPGRRLRQAVTGLVAAWDHTPPDGAVIVAGSTGSRAATAALMVAVAGLPQGAVILPGFDADLSPDAWSALDAPGSDDHPQARHRRFLARLGHPAVRPWTDAPAPDAARNRLISLALRPAPVTDQWRAKGGALPGAAQALDGVTMLAAPGPEAEALAIALALADARADGQTAALVTPDRALARRVTAALDRWGIIPDDSAGRPLTQSAPGRMLRLLARRLAGAAGSGLDLIALLKQPLVHTGADRGPHLLHLRALELWLRRNGQPFPGPDDLAAFARTHPDARVWADWLAAWLAAVPPPDTPLSPGLAALLALADRLGQGAVGTGAGELWAAQAGAMARAGLDALTLAARRAGDLTLADLPPLLDLALAGSVRDTVAADPGVAIWGPRDARARQADLVILGGLTEGTWPALPGPDPWLNRPLRAALGLRLPERSTGLAAHDFQIAAGAPRVILSAARRGAEADAVPARWVIRLTGLAQGLPACQPGLRAAQDRGAALMARAQALADDPTQVPLACARRNPRPAPAPPVAVRPTTLRVTEVADLIRNPYAIYARRVLGLSPLNPLDAQPDPRRRGTLIHALIEAFVAHHPPGQPAPLAAFLDLARVHLARDLPWPAERAMWLARLARGAPGFLAWHAEVPGQVALTETGGAFDLGGVRLTGRPDRVDRLPDGTLALWDYKTGAPPTKAQQLNFDKQLILLTLMARAGGLPGLGAVSQAAYVRVGSDFALVPAPVDAATLDDQARRLAEVFATYRRRAKGYAARRAMTNDRDRSDYDALSRRGEWALTDPSETLPVGDADG